MSDGEGDSYMTESAKESEAEAIPDSADLDPLGGVDTPGTAEPNEVIPDSAHGLCPHCQRIEPDLTGTEMIPIDPDSKWVLMLPEDTGIEIADRAAERIQNWWDGVEGYDWPILVIGGSPGLKLVRVDSDKIGPELVDCGAEHCPGHVVGDGERCCEDLYCDCEPDGDFAGQDYRCSHFEGRS